LESTIESEGTPSSESFEVRNKCLAYVVRYLFLTGKQSREKPLFLYKHNYPNEK